MHKVSQTCWNKWCPAVLLIGHQYAKEESRGMPTIWSRGWPPTLRQPPSSYYKAVATTLLSLWVNYSVMRFWLWTQNALWQNHVTPEPVPGTENTFGCAADATWVGCNIVRIFIWRWRKLWGGEREGGWRKRRRSVFQYSRLDQSLVVFTHMFFPFSLQSWGLRWEEWVHSPILLSLSLVLLVFSNQVPQKSTCMFINYPACVCLDRGKVVGGLPDVVTIMEKKVDV